MEKLHINSSSIAGTRVLGTLGVVAFVATFVAACASPVQQAGQGLDADCIDRQMPTGSNVVRRDKSCVAMTDAQRAAAREELQALRDQQAIGTQQRVAPSSGR